MNKPSNHNTNERVENILRIEEFQITRTKMWDDGKVVFDLRINGIMVYGCRVVETETGDFMALPQRKGKDGKYYSIVYFRLTDKDTQMILAEVERKLNGH